MKSRKTQSGKSKTIELVPEPPRKSEEEVPHEPTAGDSAPRETVPVIVHHADAENPSAFSRVLEQLTAGTGGTLFIAHPLTPEHQKQLAELLLADARKEASDVIQKLQRELAEAGERLAQRMSEVARLSDDLTNILRVLNTPVIVVGSDLRIIRISSAAEQLLNMSPESIGQEVTSVKLAVRIAALRDLVLNVMATSDIQEQEVVDDLGRWFKLHISPYRKGDGRVEGAVLAFFDIDAEKRSEILLHSYQLKEERYHEIIRGVLVVLDVYGTVMMINRGGCDLLDVGKTEIIGRKWFDDFVPKSNAPAARSLFDKVIKGEPGDEHEYPVMTKAGEERMISWRCALLRDHMDNVSGVMCSGEDRTSLREIKGQLQGSEDRFRLLMETAGQDEFFVTDTEGYIGTWMGRPGKGRDFSTGDMNGQHFSRLFVPEDFQSGKPMRILESAEREGRYQEECWRIRKDGTKTRALVVVIPVLDGTGKLAGFSHVTRYLSNQSAKKDTLESSFASLHGYPLREGQ